MQIRTQSGQVMYEAEFRAYTKANGGPSWETTTTGVLEALGADVVFEGPQATGGTVYQYSQASGVESVRLIITHLAPPVNPQLIVCDEPFPVYENTLETPAQVANR